MLDETGDTVRITAGPGELPPVESGPDREGSATGVAFRDDSGRATRGAVHELASWARPPPMGQLGIELDVKRCERQMRRT